MKLGICWNLHYSFKHNIDKLGALAQSDACRRSRFGHEAISTAILYLLLIQEGQLSVTGKACAPSTGKLPRWLSQEQCGQGNWQDHDQDSLLVKRRNDNHSPGPVIRELVPSSHQRSELRNTILCISSG